MERNGGGWEMGGAWVWMGWDGYSGSSLFNSGKKMGWHGMGEARRKGRWMGGWVNGWVWVQNHDSRSKLKRIVGGAGKWRKRKIWEEEENGGG